MRRRQAPRQDPSGPPRPGEDRVGDPNRGNARPWRGPSGLPMIRVGIPLTIRARTSGQTRTRHAALQRIGTRTGASRARADPSPAAGRVRRAAAPRRRRSFATLPLGDRIQLLRAMRAGYARTVPRSVESSCLAKRIVPGTVLEAEEWSLGPWPVLRQFRLLIETLSALRRRRAPPLGELGRTIDGRLSAEIFPGSVLDVAPHARHPRRGPHPRRDRRARAAGLAGPVLQAERGPRPRRAGARRGQLGRRAGAGRAHPDVQRGQGLPPQAAPAQRLPCAAAVGGIRRGDRPRLPSHRHRRCRRGSLSRPPCGHRRDPSERLPRDPRGDPLGLGRCRRRRAQAPAPSAAHETGDVGARWACAPCSSSRGHIWTGNWRFRPRPWREQWSTMRP